MPACCTPSSRPAVASLVMSAPERLAEACHPPQLMLGCLARRSSGSGGAGGPKKARKLVPRQATLARIEISRSASLSLWRLRQAM